MIGGAVDEGKSGSGLLVGTGLGGLGGGQIECLGLGDQIVEIGGLQRAGLARWIWHEALFDCALYVCVLAGLLALFATW